MMGWMRGMVVLCAMITGMTAALAAGESGVVGDWKTPGGSVVRAEWCDTKICLLLVKVSGTAKGSIDVMNPDSSLKGRALCGIKIGEGFKIDGNDAANGGHIYDPESGKTYSSKLTREGDTLKLRGFVGVAIFGRTEVWTRTGPVEACGKG